MPDKGGDAVALMVRGLSAGYGGADILHDVSFDVPPHSATCIVGPNGAGKSTLLLALSGVLKPRSGTVCLGDRMLAGASPRAILRAGVGHVPQERSLFRELTVRTNVELGGFLLNNKELVKERYASVLELFPMLKERERQRAGTLSGGQQKLVEFARCLMLRPTVMVLDEPSQGLDPSTRGLVFSTLRRMKEAGQAMLLVEQNARAGLELSDYGLVLEGGRVRLQGPAQEVLANPEIGRLYLGSNRR